MYNAAMSYSESDRQAYFQGFYSDRLRTSMPLEVVESWVWKMSDLTDRGRVRVKRPRDRVSWELLNDFENSVLFEDDDLLIVNKPPCVPSHFTGIGDLGVQEVAQYLRGPEVALVNRLDAPTTGVIALAKNEEAYTAMATQFDNRSGLGLEKRYLALLEGDLPKGRYFVEVPLVRDHNRMRIGTGLEPGALNSVTDFESIHIFDGGYNGKRTLVDVKLGTGRMHQIRVVAAGRFRLPLVGDYQYDGPNADRSQRVMLHSYELVFNHPRTQERVTVSAPIPEDFVSLIG